MMFFYLLILTMPLDQDPFWQTAIAGLTLVKYLGAICMLYALLHLSLRRKLPRYFETPQSWLFMLFVLIAGVSYGLKTLTFSLQYNPFFSLFSMLLLFFLVITVVDTPERLRHTLLAIVATGALASLYAFREWQKYHDIYAGFRPGSVAGDSNEFSVSLLFCLPVGFYMIRESTTRWQRWFCMGSLVLTAGANILAASRGGFLGLCVACLFILWHSRRRARNLVLLGVVLLPLTLLMPSSPLLRLLRPKRSETVSDHAHLDAWKAGLRMIETHPLSGIGLGNFKSLMPFYRDKDSQTDTIAHNSFLEVAAEMGLPALLIFLGILYLSYRTLGRARQRAQLEGLPLLNSATLALQAGLVGFLVGGFFMSAEQVKLLWLTIALAACFPELIRVAEGAKTAEMPAAKRLAFFRTTPTEPSFEASGPWWRIRPQPAGELARSARRPNLSTEVSWSPGGRRRFGPWKTS